MQQNRCDKEKLEKTLEKIVFHTSIAIRIPLADGAIVPRLFDRWFWIKLYIYVVFPAVCHQPGQTGKELLINKVAYSKSRPYRASNIIQSWINRKDQLLTVYVRGEVDDIAD
jgi:hypothetical protein